MRSRLLLLLLLIPGLAGCGGDPVPAPAPAPAAIPPEEAPIVREEPGPLPPPLRIEDPRDPDTERYPASLLRPLDGFPLPSGTRLEHLDRDLAEYEAAADLRTVEGFYRERGFQVLRPGRLAGLIVTRGDSGTRLQVLPGPHRTVILRFYR